MPKPYDLNLHKSYNVNNNDKNYKSFTDANGEQWYTDKPLTTYNNNKLAYVTKVGILNGLLSVISSILSLRLQLKNKL